MGIDRALGKHVNYQIEKQYQSNFDYEVYEVNEKDRVNLIEKESNIFNAKNTIEKNLYIIAKSLYEAQQLLSNYKTGSFSEWFINLGLEKNYVYRMIDKYNLFLETESKKAIDLPIRLITDMKKQDLTIEQKKEIVESDKPNLKFKELNILSHSETNNINELDILEKQLKYYMDKVEETKIRIEKYKSNVNMT